MEVKGTLSLTANSDGANKCKVVLASTDPSGAFTFQTHPKVMETPMYVELMLVLGFDRQGFTPRYGNPGVRGFQWGRKACLPKVMKITFYRHVEAYVLHMGLS